jgi:hypothetical protein
LIRQDFSNILLKDLLHIMERIRVAVVQWTNLFLPTDPVGGQLEPVFGSGIHDIELPDAPEKRWSDHVRYWAVGSKPGSERFKLEILKLLGERRALNGEV